MLTITTKYISEILECEKKIHLQLKKNTLSAAAAESTNGERKE